MTRRTAWIPKLALVAALVAAMVVGALVASVLTGSSDGAAGSSGATTVIDGVTYTEGVSQAKSLDEPWPLVGAISGLLFVGGVYAVIRWRGSRRTQPAG